MELKVIDANRGRTITDSKFKNYDLCINPYVGCQFGCKYCYVRFFVKDEEKDWGEFVRLRRHLVTKLPKELPAAAGRRIVIGTMTDPYQPLERKHRLTRAVLEAILDADDPPGKVGIFTRSPIVTEDLELIKQLPRARVHYTVTPFNRSVLRQIEPIAISTQRRWDTIKILKDAGIRVHVNVSPAIPLLSEEFTEDFASKIAELGVDEFYVDPMQAYGEALIATKEAIGDVEEWEEIEKILISKERYQEWKDAYRAQWLAAWQKQDAPNTLALWQDHIRHIHVNMATGEDLDPNLYGDDLEETKG